MCRGWIHHATQRGFARPNLAKTLALTAGGFFTSIKDWPHVQLRNAASPLGMYTLQQIDAEMKSRFHAADDNPDIIAA